MHFIQPHRLQSHAPAIAPDCFPLPCRRKHVRRGLAPSQRKVAPSISTSHNRMLQHTVKVSAESLDGVTEQIVLGTSPGTMLPHAKCRRSWTNSSALQGAESSTREDSSLGVANGHHAKVGPKIRICEVHLAPCPKHTRIHGRYRLRYHFVLIAANMTDDFCNEHSDDHAEKASLRSHTPSLSKKKCAATPATQPCADASAMLLTCSTPLCANPLVNEANTTRWKGWPLPRSRPPTSP